MEELIHRTRRIAASFPDFAKVLGDIVSDAEKLQIRSAALAIRICTERWMVTQCAAGNVQVPAGVHSINDLRPYLAKVETLEQRDVRGPLTIISTVSAWMHDQKQSMRVFEENDKRLEAAWWSLLYLFELPVPPAEEMPPLARTNRWCFVPEPLEPAPSSSMGPWREAVAALALQEYGAVTPEEADTDALRIAFRAEIVSLPEQSPRVVHVTFVHGATGVTVVLARFELREHRSEGAARDDAERLRRLPTNKVYAAELCGIECGRVVVIRMPTLEVYVPWTERALAVLDDPDAVRAFAMQLTRFSKDLVGSCLALENEQLTPRVEFLANLAHALVPDVRVNAAARACRIAGGVLDIADGVKRYFDYSESPEIGTPSRLIDHVRGDPALTPITLDLTRATRHPSLGGAMDLIDDQGRHLRLELPADEIERAADLVSSARAGGAAAKLRFSYPDPQAVVLREAELDRRLVDSTLFKSALDAVVKVRTMRQHARLDGDSIVWTEGGLVATTLGTLEIAPAGLDIARLEHQLWVALSDAGVMDAISPVALAQALAHGLAPVNGREQRVYALVAAIRAASADLQIRERAVSHLAALASSEETAALGDKAFEVLRALGQEWLRLLLAEGTAAVPLWAPEAPRRPDGPTGPAIAALWEEALASADGEMHADVRLFLGTLTGRSGALMRSSLTALQRDALEKCEMPDSHPFRSQRHVIITGPTSSGKSTIADLFLARAAILNNERRCALYIAPTKALAQARHRELLERYAGTEFAPFLRADRIVLSTSDDTESDPAIIHGRFDIACMVYEKANILFSRAQAALSRLGCVVVDELHMITDLERGPTLELAITKALREADRSGDEFLKVVAISTEDDLQGHMEKFLTAPSATLFGSARKPLTITGPQRPRPVQHLLVLPPSEPDQLFDIEEIHTFDVDDARVLTREQRTAIDERIHAKRDARDRVAGGDASEDLWRRGHAFISQWLATNPRSRRLLCFVPSRARLHELAQLVASRAERRPDVPELVNAANDLDTDDARECVALTNRGVFIHYADLHRELRTATEQAFARPLPPNGASETLFATETLSYGVNLAIDDVLLLGTDFPSADRLREPNWTPLDPSAFHNMAGRCGRLGPQGHGTARVFVLVKSQARPARAILDAYYKTPPQLESRLFVREDQVAAQRVEARKATESPLNAAVELTYPFARAVLDALRHRWLESESNVELADILEIFMRTHFGSVKLADGTGGEKPHAVVFGKQIESVLKGAADQELKLVAASGSRYKITERGEAVIDTGTDIRTIQPLVAIIRSVSAVWRARHPKVPLPSYLYVLCVVAQEEIMRLARDYVPELAQGRRRFSQQETDDMRNVVAAAFQKTMGIALRDAGLDDGGADALAAAIISDCLAASPLVQKLGPSAEDGLNGLLRLYAAVIGWIEGEDERTVRALVSGAKGGGLPGTFNVARFGEQVSWKTVCLARMLATADAGDLVDVHSPSEERRVFLLTMQLRHGCKAAAIPFFFSSAGQLRHIVHQWLAAGVDPSMVLTSSASRVERRVGPRNLSQLRRFSKAIRSYALHSLKGLEKEITAQPRTPGEASGARRLASELWTGVVRATDVLSGKRFYQADKPGQGLEFLHEVLMTATVDPQLPGWVTFRHRGMNDSRRRPGLELQLRDEEGKPTSTHCVAAVQTNVRGQFCLGGDWLDPRRMLELFADAPRLLLIPFPWVPHLEVPVLAAFEDATRVPDRALTFCSPAAFATIIMAIARKFFSSSRAAAGLLAGRAPDEAEAASVQRGYRWVGVDEVVNELDRLAKRPGATAVPEPIRAALLQLFEPRPARNDVA